MKPVDKFGNPIYPNTWNKMLVHAAVLIGRAYSESIKKPNLFYRKDDQYKQIIYFADMRGTEEVPIWSDVRPLFYVKFERDFPHWLRNRCATQEFNKLRMCREPFETDPDDYQINQGNDGYCRTCDRDFEGDGDYCCQACNKAQNDLHDPLCRVCHKPIPWDKFDRHHISYKDNITLSICRSCHRKIDRGDTYPNLKAIDPENAPHKRT